MRCIYIVHSIVLYYKLSVCPSVCLSVCLPVSLFVRLMYCGHGIISWGLICCCPKISDLDIGEHSEILVRIGEHGGCLSLFLA